MRRRSPSGGAGRSSINESAAIITERGETSPMKGPSLYPLTPGGRIPDDWVDRCIPANVAVGQHTVIDSAFGFQHFYSEAPIGLRIGSHVTICRTMFSTEPGAEIVIGDYCFLSHAAFA